MFLLDSTPAVASPELNPRSRRQWAEQIGREWHDRRLASVLKAGTSLLSAKAELERGQFQLMIERELPFGKRTAQMLMAVGSHPSLLSKTNHGSLPSSWRTLYALSRLKETVLLAAIENGTIHPGMRRENVAALAGKPPRTKTTAALTLAQHYEQASKAEQATLLTQMVQAASVHDLLQDMTAAQRDELVDLAFGPRSGAAAGIARRIEKIVRADPKVRDLLGELRPTALKVVIAPLAA